MRWIGAQARFLFNRAGSCSPLKVFSQELSTVGVSDWRCCSPRSVRIRSFSRSLSDTACFYLLICIAGQLSSQKILHHSLLPSLRPFKLQVQPAQLRRPGCDLFLCSVKEMLCHLYSVHSLLNFLVNQLGQGIQQNTLLMSVAAGGQNAGVVQPTNDSRVAYALQLLLKD